jgi:flagellar motor switch protein FliG
VPVFKPKEKNKRPFSLLFQRLSPAEFAAVFRDEHLQTLAFMLSYAPRKSYAKKAIKRVADKAGREGLMLALQSIQKTQMPADTAFIAGLEKAALQYIEY